jgi:hypothetical protein
MEMLQCIRGSAIRNAHRRYLSLCFTSLDIENCQESSDKMLQA